MQEDSEYLAEEKRKEIAAHLVSRLDYCRKHKKKFYDGKFEDWEKLIKGEFGTTYKKGSDNRNEAWRSDIFYKIIRQKLNAALSQIDDAYASGGSDFPFDLKETPESESPARFNEQLKEIGIDIKEIIVENRKRISDNLIESKSAHALKLAVRDAGIYGTGCFISPHVTEGLAREFDYSVLQDLPEIESENGELTPDGKEMAMQFLKDHVAPSYKIVPKERLGIHRVKPTLIYPDPACKGDSQKGFGVFVKSYLALNDLKKLADETIPVPSFDAESREEVTEEQPRYFKEAIKQVLDEYYSTSDGRGDRSVTDNGEDRDDDRSGIPVFTFYGDLTRRDFEELHAEQEYVDKEKDDLSDYETVSVIAEFIEEGNRLIRLEENPLPSKRRPIHFFQWDQNDDEWVGMGMAEKLGPLQIELNQFIQYWADNLKLSSHVILAVIDELLEEGEDLSMFPGKVISLKTGQHIREIIQQFSIDDRSASFERGIIRLFEMIDSEAGVPRVLEGQANPANKTAFEIQQQESHALKQLGMTIRNIDSAISEGIELIYEYLNELSEQKGIIPGDFKIIATGYNSYESARIKVATLQNTIAMAESSEIGREILDLNEAWKELFRLMDKNNDRFFLSEEAIKKRQEAEAQGQQQAIEQQRAMQVDIFQMQEQAKQQLEMMRFAEKEKERQHEVLEAEKDRNHDAEKVIMAYEERRGEA